MTIKKLLERCNTLGLPIAKDAFSGTVDNPVPDLPYLVYMVQHTVGRGADTKSNLITVADFSLELYTVDEDPNRDTLEKQIEKTVFCDIEYDKYQAQIEEEDSYQTAYEVNGLVMKTKGAF